MRLCHNLKHEKRFFFRGQGGWSTEREKNSLMASTISSREEMGEEWCQVTGYWSIPNFKC